jgi:FMN-dependent NADH-azoreductase
MKNILVVEVSPRGSESISRQISASILAKLRTKYPDAVVVTEDLALHPLPHLDQAFITAMTTPHDRRNEEHLAALAKSQLAVEHLKNAETILISFPVFNFSIPSALKAWVDHIVRPGLTFRPTPQGPEGLLKGKKVYLASASGQVYLPPPTSPAEFGSIDFSISYMKYVLGYLGMTDVTVFRAEGVGRPQLRTASIEAVMKAIEAEVF